jgi:hypothetical protein
MYKLLIIFLFLINIETSQAGFFSRFFPAINCKPNSSKNLNRNGSLSSIVAGQRSWSFLNVYAGVVDGNQGWVAGNMIASAGNENHNGYGFQLNFNRPLALQMLYVFGYVTSVSQTNYLIEYYNGSSWISLETFSGATVVTNGGKFIFNGSAIKSSNWRWSIQNWGLGGAYPNTNYYLYEVEAYEDACKTF